MKRFMVMIVVMVTLPLIALGQSSDRKSRLDAKVEQELRSLVRMWDEADVKGDAAALDRLLAAEFAFVGGLTKAQYLAQIKTKPPDFFIDSALSTDVQVQVYGNTAIVTGLDTITGRNKGQPYVNKWLYMDVWIKRDGRWQCVKTYSALAGKT